MRLLPIRRASALLVSVTALLTLIMAYLCCCNTNFPTRKALSVHEATCTQVKERSSVTSLLRKRKLIEERTRAMKRMARSDVSGETSTGRVHEGQVRSIAMSWHLYISFTLCHRSAIFCPVKTSIPPQNLETSLDLPPPSVLLVQSPPRLVLHNSPLRLFLTWAVLHVHVTSQGL